MGGWLEMEKGAQAIQESFDLDSEQMDQIKSIVIIGNQKAKIVGIYPYRDIIDLIPILKLHPTLADFNLLPGVEEFGPLRVGAMSPVKSGDPTGYHSRNFSNLPYKYIPTGKKFYVFSMQKEMFQEKGDYCAFHECAWTDDCECSGCTVCSDIAELGGWFSSDGKAETARLFGLEPAEVKSGQSSLVAVTDHAGRIAALHPGKTISDIISILKQLPELVDVEEIYQRSH